MEKIMGWKFEGVEDMTGLPEYRNGTSRLSHRERSSDQALGGLLVDLGVLTLRPNTIPSVFYPDPESSVPRLPASHPAIVEWRAMTVIELYAGSNNPCFGAYVLCSDRIAEAIRKNFAISTAELTLAQVLESGTWKGGRQIARQKRPETGGPPIDIESDGTVF